MNYPYFKLYPHQMCYYREQTDKNLILKFWCKIGPAAKIFSKVCWSKRPTWSEKELVPRGLFLALSEW